MRSGIGLLELALCEVFCRPVILVLVEHATPSFLVELHDARAGRITFTACPILLPQPQRNFLPLVRAPGTSL